MNPPSDIDDLSHRSAQALVQTMDTDRWPLAREWLIGFFMRMDYASTTELAKIEHSRELLIQADSEDLDVLRRAAIKSLAHRLRQVLNARAAAGNELRAFIATQTDTTPAQTPHSVQNAWATDNSQIFQATGSQTINLDGRRTPPHRGG